MPQIPAGDFRVLMNKISVSKSPTCQFLERTAQNFANKAHEFSKKAGGTLPLCYTEKTLRPLLWQSAERADAFAICEHRVKKKDKPFGWVDVLAFHEETRYLIEAKHCLVRWNPVVTKMMIQKWQEVIKDVREIELDSLPRFGLPIRDTIRVALLTLSVRRENEAECTVKPTEARDWCNRTVRQFHPSPNWSAAWTLSQKDLQRPKVKSAGKYESYPCFLFLARVS